MSPMFRKKPILVEAYQLTARNINLLWEEFVPAEFLTGPLPAEPGFSGRPARLYVAANDAWLDIEPGEWILKDALGFYPCKQSIFAATYEDVPQDSKPEPVLEAFDSLASNVLSALGAEPGVWV